MQTTTTAAPKSHRADVPVGLSGVDPHDDNVAAIYHLAGPTFVTHEPGVVALVLTPAAAADIAAAIVAGIHAPGLPAAQPEAMQAIAIHLLEHGQHATDHALKPEFQRATLRRWPHPAPVLVEDQVAGKRARR